MTYTEYFQGLEKSGKFNDAQLKEIKAGKEDGLLIEEIMQYAKPELSAEKMRSIRKELCRKKQQKQHKKAKRREIPSWIEDLVNSKQDNESDYDLTR